MANKGFESWLKPLILTIIGGIILAFIIGEGTLFEGKSLTDQVSNVKSTIAVKQAYCEMEVINNLLIPVEISVDDEYITTLEPNSSQNIKGPFESRTLSFVGRSPYSSAEDMSGYFTIPIVDDVVYTVNNKIGDNYYFFLDITNLSSLACDVYVNRGYEHENYAGRIVGYQENFRAGYFGLFSNSNIVVECDNGATRYWGDFKEYQKVDSVFDNASVNTGFFTGTIPAE